MIEMTYSTARAISRNRELLIPLVESNLSFRVSYNLRKILDKVGQAAQEFDIMERNTQLDLAKKYAEKSENGEFKTELPEGKTEDSDRVICFTDENKAKTARELFMAVQEYGSKTLKINRDKLDLSKEDVKFRLVDLPLIDSFVLDLEEGKPQAEEGPAATVTQIHAQEEELKADQSPS